MALGPEHLITARKDAIRQAEQMIDNSIKLAKTGYVTITPSRLGLFSHEFYTLKAKYLAAGWRRVEWVVDQREGDYIVLSTIA